MSEINITQCPVCQVTKYNGAFYFKFNNEKGLVNPSDPEKVYSRVCRHARFPGCINSCTNYSAEKDYTPLPTSFDAQIKEYDETNGQ